MEVKKMSYIYKITNDINNKIYVGKTNLPILERFRQHCRDSKKISEEHRPLYAAMQKYGQEHFHIELIEECSTNKSSEREQYWIGYYKGYENGYNATKGGDGSPIFNHEAIAQALKENPYPIQIAKLFNCSPDTVYTVAQEYNIETKHIGKEININPKKIVSQYDKKNNQYIQTFESVRCAVEWLKQNNIIPTINSGVSEHIAEVANGKRKTAYGYIWKYEK